MPRSSSAAFGSRRLTDAGVHARSCDVVVMDVYSSHFSHSHYRLVACRLVCESNQR